MIEARGRLGVGGALRRGFSQAVGLWPSTLLLFLARSVEVMASLAFALIALRSVQSKVPLFWATIGAWLTTWIISQVVRAIVLGGAIGQGTQRMRGLQSPLVVPSMAAGALAAVWYWLSSLLVQLFVAAWRVLALLVGLWTYLLSPLTKSGGVLGSAALALAITVALPLAMLGSLWTEVALVRSISLGRAYWIALYDSAVAIGRQFWKLMGVLFATGFLAWTAQVALSGMLGFRPLSAGALTSALWITQRGILGLLMSFLLAVLEMTRVQAVVAFTLDLENELPGEAEWVSVPVVEAVAVADILPSHA